MYGFDLSLVSPGETRLRPCYLPCHTHLIGSGIKKASEKSVWEKLAELSCEKKARGHSAAGTSKLTLPKKTEDNSAGVVRQVRRPARVSSLCMYIKHLPVVPPVPFMYVDELNSARPELTGWEALDIMGSQQSQLVW